MKLTTTYNQHIFIGYSSAMRFSKGYAVSTVRLRFFPFQPLRTTLPAAAFLRGPGHSQNSLDENFAQVTLENPLSS